MPRKWASDYLTPVERERLTDSSHLTGMAGLMFWFRAASFIFDPSGAGGFIHLWNKWMRDMNEGEIPDTILDLLFDKWIGIPNVFEFKIIEEGIPVRPAFFMRAMFEIGNIATITDIDTDRMIEDDMIAYIPWVDFRIGGTTAYFPIQGSEKWTFSGKPTTWPRVFLNIAILLALAIGLIYFGPRFIDLLKTAFPQLATLALSAYSTVSQGLWKIDVMERFNNIDLWQDEVLPALLSNTVSTLQTSMSAETTTIVTEVQTTEADIKAYILSDVIPSINRLVLDVENVMLKIGLGL